MKFLIAFVALFALSCAGTVAVEEAQVAPAAEVAEQKTCEQNDPPDCDVEAVPETVEALAEEAPVE